MFSLTQNISDLARLTLCAVAFLLSKFINLEFYAVFARCFCAIVCALYIKFHKITKLKLRQGEFLPYVERYKTTIGLPKGELWKRRE